MSKEGKLNDSYELWRSVVDGIDANDDFSKTNLPYGVCSRGEETFLATRLGEFVIRLEALPLSIKVLSSDRTWNRIMGSSKQQRVSFRESLKRALFHEDSKSGLFHRDDKGIFVQNNVFPYWECTTRLPCEIGDYTDFYCSRNHAYNVGVMFRGKDNALQPNWVHLPVGYHGRASSVIVSPCSVVHPRGQLDEGKTYAPSRKLDFELEVGCLIGGPENPLGVPMTVDEARDRIFGYVLLNDWSARDVQNWEYVPLGPFNAKNFCTTISPWIIPYEALAPHSKALEQPQSPTPLPYLRDNDYALPDVDLYVSITPTTGGGCEETVVCKSNLRFLYWTPAQMIAHHASTGCNLRPGDLIGSGTISGTEPDSFGSMLELSWNGTKPVTLKSGVGTRTFLQDGDMVRMWGRSRTGGIGFGDCTGLILPPRPDAKI